MTTSNTKNTDNFNADSYLGEKWMIFINKLPSLYFGIFLFALGDVLMLQANLGMSAFGVFNVGLMNVLGFSFGQVTQLVGFCVLILGWAMGFQPGWTTVNNMVLIGYFIDLIIGWGIIAKVDHFGLQLTLLFTGMAIIGIVVFFNLSPKLGAGPKDGLMMGLVQRLDGQVSAVKTGIELTVLTLGIAMGGPVGIGTAITAFCIGWFIQTAFRIGNYDRKAKHMNLYDLAKNLGGN